MSITLKEIAERANVSAMTVSRILNGRDDGFPIREETRQRVLTIAKEAGYKPNLMARALRGGRSSLLGVIVRDITESFFSQIVKGINAAAVERHYRVFLGHVEERPDKTRDYGSMFEQVHSDGILIIGDMQHDADAVGYLLKRHQCLVGITDRVQRRQFPGVYTDNDRGVTLAMEHLWGLGHREILCVSDATINDGLMRAEIYQRFMHEHGVAEVAEVLFTKRFSEESYHKGQEIFSREQLPTAIVAATDSIAIGLMQAAFEANINIPQNLSIIGYDNIDVARFLIPSLTTVSQPGFEMGHAATRMLISMISGEQKRENIDDVILIPELIVRKSTAAPATKRT